MLRTLFLVGAIGSLSWGQASALAMRSSAAAAVEPWGKLSVTPAGGQDAIDVEVATVSKANTAGARPESTWINDKTERFWVAEKHARRGGVDAPVQWADSRTCTAMVETLVTLTDVDGAVPTPSIRISGAGRAGATYALEAGGLRAAAADAKAVHLTNGQDAPAASVVDAALTAWAPCWSDTPPNLED